MYARGYSAWHSVMMLMLLAAAESDLTFRGRVDLVTRRRTIRLGQLLADAFDAAEIAGRRGQNRGRIAESVQQPPADSRPDAFDHSETNRVDQIGVGEGHGGRS